MRRLSTALLPAVLALALAAGARAAQPEPAMLDLTRAVVVTPPGLTGPEEQAVIMLVEEVEERSGVRWRRAGAWPDDGSPVVAVGPAASLPGFAGRYAPELAAEPQPPGREGYRVRTRAGAPGAVLIVGADSRGVLYGAGRLLRTLACGRGSVRLAHALDVSTAPKYALRGHQLGYRPKTNSYDGWSLPMWEQYVRDLAIFGVNAVELIPPRSDDDADSPHFPLPPMEMMVGMSRLLDRYGLDMWIWYPALDPDYSDPKWVEFAIKEWDEVFRRLPRIDALLVPGGDPGHTHPRYLMPMLEKQTESLRRRHPKAQMWVAPQGFTAEWMEAFLGILRREPAWLTGVVFGPQCRMSVQELRAAVPERYPIRHYPDITHTVRCQYPMADWDPAYALTEGREPINPRPLMQARIFRQTQPSTAGFITYSEGCNDDVNKCVWSALGWDPDADVSDLLREYARVYLGERYVDSFSRALLALERNWDGPLGANDGVPVTLQQLQALERAATPAELRNWRFQQALYRAYYDAYTRARLLYETGLEERSMERLREAPRTGALPAIAAAEELLACAESERVAPAWRARVFELAEALFQSVRMQLSVERYRAIGVERGANLDQIDAPLNNRVWLQARLAAARALPVEADRLAALAAVVDWTNPGPGGVYEDCGRPGRPTHFLRGPGLAADPSFSESTRTGFNGPGAGRLSWSKTTETLYDHPLRARFEGLDPGAQYRLRVVYGGDNPPRQIRLVAAGAGGEVEVHPLQPKPQPQRPVEFDLPAEITRRGVLTLTWTGEPGVGGNGRGCSVSELWLLRR